MISGVRQRVRSTLLRVSGLAERRWRTLPEHLYCFNYHRIGDRQHTPFDPNVFSCTAENFDRQLALIKKDFRLTTLDELIDIVESKASPREKLALLTFDDGYVDGYTEALPILQHHKASGVFFVTGDFVESEAIPWWDLAAWWIKNASVSSCHLPELGLRLNLREPDRVDTVIKNVLSALKRNPETLSENLNKLEAALAPRRQPAENPALFMNWAQLKALIHAGMHVGSHTQTHRILSDLDEDALEIELAGSRTFLEENLGAPISALAYPVGTPGTFDKRAMNAARDAGYSVGFSFLERSNSLPVKDRFSISRIGVDNNPTPEELKLKVTYHSRG